MDQNHPSQGSISKKRKELNEELELKGSDNPLIAMQHEPRIKERDDFTSIEISKGKKSRQIRTSMADLEAQDEFDKCTNEDRAWVDSLSETQLDIMISIKQLAMERMISTTEKSLEGILPGTALQAIGVILEELIQERMKKIIPSLQNGLPRECERLGTSSSDDSDKNCLASLSTG